jgi:anhydro-N-acetylmuramic acid kinase
VPRFIGLISVTSMDGIDAALLEVSTNGLRLENYLERPYPEKLHAELSELLRPCARVSLEEVGRIDAVVGIAFAETALELVRSAGVSRRDISAIGSHGQTVCHTPLAPHPFSMQLGNPAVIAALTGIDVVSDFRAMDLALGGQGAPLVPRLHLELFTTATETTAVVNIGGIANVTLLPRDARASEVIAFDTGPGNTLMDVWANRHLGTAFDHDGGWSAAGVVLAPLLQFLLSDQYFSSAPPKSTGREYFNVAWIENALRATRLTVARPEDIQRTLLELTALSVATQIDRWLPECGRVVFCGGGIRNGCLMARLASLLPRARIMRTDELGIPADAVEAVTFAWLAYRRLARLPGNLPNATGASSEAVLGSHWLA